MIVPIRFVREPRPRGSTRGGSPALQGSSAPSVHNLNPLATSTCRPRNVTVKTSNAPPRGVSRGGGSRQSRARLGRPTVAPMANVEPNSTGPPVTTPNLARERSSAGPTYLAMPTCHSWVRLPMRLPFGPVSSRARACPRPQEKITHTHTCLPRARRPMPRWKLAPISP